MAKKKEERIEYTVRKSKRAKRMRLAVYCDGTIILTSPVGVRTSIAERFFEEKKQWVLRKLEMFRSANVISHAPEDFLAYRDDALVLVTKRVLHFNKNLGVNYNKIIIKNQKTRWGSCSKKGNLNINYKILYLPKRMQDYVIVHEMCHLKEFNHSKRFWSLVEAVLSEYSEIRKELNNYGIIYR